MSKKIMNGNNILKKALQETCQTYCNQYPRYEGEINLDDEYKIYMKRLVKRSKNPIYMCFCHIRLRVSRLIIGAIPTFLAILTVCIICGTLMQGLPSKDNTSDTDGFLPLATEAETTTSDTTERITIDQTKEEETNAFITEEMTITEFTEDTTTEIPSGEFIEPPVYEDLFESFMRFPSSNQYFLGKATLEKYQTDGSSIVLFRVIGMEEKYVGDFMIYLVQIVDVYGIKNYDTDKVYRMAWRGHLEEHLYGRPPLEVGKIYGRLMALNEGDLEIYNLWQAGLIYDVKEENGKRYLYAYGTDLSQYHCKIPITDPEENSIYKPGKHDKAIAKLNELGQPLPTFDYKVEAEAFYKELN